MDTVTTFVSLRFAERICAVIGGGLSISLGYRLFLEVPQRHDSSGKVILPWDITVVLTRVGPGIFFALFGAAVVGSSFFKGMEYGDVQRAIESGAAKAAPELITLREHSTTISGAGSGVPQSSDRSEARSLLRREIAVLNTLPSNLKPGLPKYEREEIMRSARNIKFALMRDVWDSGEWGPMADFEAWLARDEPEPVPATIAQAVKYYRYAGESAKP